MHTIIIPCEDDEEIVIPLILQGVTSYFSTRKSTLQEVETAERSETYI